MHIYRHNTLSSELCFALTSSICPSMRVRMCSNTGSYISWISDLQELMPFNTGIKLCKPEETCFQSNSRYVNSSRYWDLIHIFTILYIGIELTFEQTIKGAY